MKKHLFFIALVCSLLIGCKPDPVLPTVKTNGVDEITESSALCHGKVTDNGNATVTEKGFCWSTNQDPTLQENYVIVENSKSDEPAVSDFSLTISGLEANTTYYVRAFATNSEGTAYGENVSFNTLEEDNGGEIVVELPTVSNVTVSEISVNAAKIEAEVLTDGGADVTERGFYWQNADAEQPNKVQVGEGLGGFTYNLTGLTESTTYSVYAYAVNSAGEVISEAVTFTTEEDGGEEIVYEYVDLGLPSGVKWAMHNVGTTYSEGYGDHFAWGEIEPKEEYTVDNCSSYYKDLGDISGNPLYDAAAAKWGDGWRMPTLEEMYELTQECIWTWVDENGITGYKVTSKTNGNYIFLPAAGFRVNDELIDKDLYGYYWMSTPYEEEGTEPTFKKATFLDMCSYQFYCNWSIRRNGMTIRPVKD